MLWAGRTLREQAHWARAAAVTASERSGAAQSELQSLIEQRDVLAAPLQEFAHRDGPATMSSAALGKREVERLGTLIALPAIRQRGRVQSLRTAAVITPQPMSEARLEDLDRRYNVWAPPHIDMPA